MQPSKPRIAIQLKKHFHVKKNTTTDIKKLHKTESGAYSNEYKASLALFFGLSAANALGWAVQLLFFGICLSIIALHKHRLPLTLITATLLCGVIATITSISKEQSIDPLLRFSRPLIEGYLLAILLYHGCRTRTIQSLLTALLGYVLLELTSTLLMASFPELRSTLLESWYTDVTTQGQAFQGALQFRGFGITRHHLFGYPLALGIISVLLLNGANQEPRPLRNFMLICGAICCTSMALINARTGLLPIITYYTLGVSIFFRISYLRQLLVAIGIGSLFILLAHIHPGENTEALINWLEVGLMQFISPSVGATTIGDLKSMTIFPATSQAWLIGDGRICQPAESCYSDIGFIRLLQEGGLALTTGVMSLYILTIFKIYRGISRLNNNKKTPQSRASRRILLSVLIATFILASIKGEAYAANDYSRLMMMLAILMHQLPRPSFVNQHEISLSQKNDSPSH